MIYSIDNSITRVSPVSPSPFRRRRSFRAVSSGIDKRMKRTDLSPEIVRIPADCLTPDLFVVVNRGPNVWLWTAALALHA